MYKYHGWPILCKSCQPRKDAVEAGFSDPEGRVKQARQKFLVIIRGSVKEKINIMGSSICFLRLRILKDMAKSNEKKTAPKKAPKSRAKKAK